MYKYLHAVQHSPTMASYLLRSKAGSLEDLARLRMAADWLLRSQQTSKGTGYAHSYHLAYGWQPAYPETTGYIIPSLLRVSSVLQDKNLQESVDKALRWLIRIQSADGSFFDLQGQPQVFDTGQILIGLNYVAEFYPAFGDVHDLISRAANWLVETQDGNGSFVRHAYNDRPHAYYSRVGATLVKSGMLLNDDKIRNAGLKNLEWTLGQQDQSGFFYHASFDDNPPFLHTMVYIVEGFLDAYDHTQDDNYYKSAFRFIEKMLDLKGGLDLPRSQYHSDFTVANPDICVTGLAQWAGICFRLAGITAENKYRREALQVMDYLAAQQIISRNKNIRGSLPGSVPIQGNYLKYAFPNWGIKFYIDALLYKQKADEGGLGDIHG